MIQLVPCGRASFDPGLSARVEGSAGSSTSPPPSAYPWSCSALPAPWTGSRSGFPHQDPEGLSVSADQAGLDEDLEAWTLNDQANPAFSPPSGESADHRTAPQVMRQAFATAVSHLSSALGGAPPQWTWGRLHSREFPALSGANGLG